MLQVYEIFAFSVPSDLFLNPNMIKTPSIDFYYQFVITLTCCCFAEFFVTVYIAIVKIFTENLP